MEAIEKVKTTLMKHREREIHQTFYSPFKLTTVTTTHLPNKDILTTTAISSSIASFMVVVLIEETEHHRY
jgi:hypothetical protein